jgi:hypothetical protein
MTYEIASLITFARKAAINCGKVGPDILLTLFMVEIRIQPLKERRINYADKCRRYDDEND